MFILNVVEREKEWYGENGDVLFTEEANEAELVFTFRYCGFLIPSPLEISAPANLMQVIMSCEKKLL